jgi:hypothetical protein
LTAGSWEQPGSRLGSYAFGEVVDDDRLHVGRDRHCPHACVRLGPADCFLAVNLHDEPSPHVHDAPLPINVLALEPEDFATAQLAPGGQQNGGGHPFPHGVDRGRQLGDRDDGPLWCTLGASSLHLAR